MVRVYPYRFCITLSYNLVVVKHTGGSMKHFLIWASGFAYCVDEYAVNKKEARKQFMKRWKLSRMPNGSLIVEA